MGFPYWVPTFSHFLLMGSVPWKGIAIICFGSLSFLASQWMLIKLVEVSEKGGEVEIGLGIKSQQGALCLLTFYEIVILFSHWVSFLGSKSFLSKEWLETGEMFWCRWWWCGAERRVTFFNWSWDLQSGNYSFRRKLLDWENILGLSQIALPCTASIW